MNKSILTRWVAASWLASVCLCLASLSITGAAAWEQSGKVPAADPRLDLVTTLQAMDPHPSLGDQAKVFGRFVGTWNVEYTDFSKDGKISHRSGELIVGWVMDGRAIQDLWIVYPSGARKDREVYTDLRYFDPKSHTWPAAFIDPEHASMARFAGGAVGDDRIVLDTKDFDGTDTRWSINDIRPDSFVWREEESLDGGKTWRLLAEHHMKRRGAATTGNTRNAPAADPRLDMITALQALRPHPSLADQANVFGRFVGTWDGEYTEYSKDGKATHSLGEWVFGWVMDGRAMQDLFIINPSAAHQKGFVGTTLRYFDPKSGTWSVTFIDPENDSVATLTGGAEGDNRIVLHEQTADGKETRWSFDDIRLDSWVFRDEETRDGGKTWRLREEDHMKRRGAAPRDL
jgi:hypothetical protein